jgi:hypothetical protein
VAEKPRQYQSLRQALHAGPGAHAALIVESDRMNRGSESALFGEGLFDVTPPGFILRVGNVVDLPVRTLAAHPYFFVPE